MVDIADAPKSLVTLRSHHLNEATESVVVFSAVACIFWVLDFGTGASPSVPRLLISVTVPVALIKEYVVYTSAVKRLGFVDVPKTALAESQLPVAAETRTTVRSSCAKALRDRPTGA